MEKGDTHSQISSVQNDEQQSQRTLNILELMKGLDHINDIVQYKAAIYDRLVQYAGQTVAFIVFTEDSQTVNEALKACSAKNTDSKRKGSAKDKEDDYPEELNPFSSDDEDEEETESVEKDSDLILTVKNDNVQILSDEENVHCHSDKNKVQSSSEEESVSELKVKEKIKPVDDDYPEELNPFSSDDEEEEVVDENKCVKDEKNIEKVIDETKKDEKMEIENGKDGNSTCEMKKKAPPRPPPFKTIKENDTPNKGCTTPPKRPPPPKTSKAPVAQIKAAKSNVTEAKKSSPMGSLRKGFLNMLGLRKKGSGH